MRRRFVIFLIAALVSIFGAVSCQEIDVEQPGDEKDTVVKDQPQKQDCLG